MDCLRNEPNLSAASEDTPKALLKLTLHYYIRRHRQSKKYTSTQFYYLQRKIVFGLTKVR